MQKQDQENKKCEAKSAKKDEWNIFNQFSPFEKPAPAQAPAEAGLSGRAIAGSFDLASIERFLIYLEKGFSRSANLVKGFALWLVHCSRSAGVFDFKLSEVTCTAVASCLSRLSLPILKHQVVRLAALATPLPRT